VCEDLGRRVRNAKQVQSLCSLNHAKDRKGKTAIDFATKTTKILKKEKTEKLTSCI